MQSGEGVGRSVNGLPNRLLPPPAEEAQPGEMLVTDNAATRVGTCPLEIACMRVYVYACILVVELSSWRLKT